MLTLPNKILVTMASPSTQIQPAQSGEKAAYPKQLRRGLLHKFNSRCPPLVTRDTTIIAVCGPNDFEGNAHPQKDGWMISDFYLFHHLLRGTATKQQYWLTCVKPQNLVDQYTQFIHGDPHSTDQRIVLDKTLIADVQDVLVCSPDDLLTEFLAQVASSCEAAKETQHPILILIFAYGPEETFPLTIGGAGEHRSCPLLTRDLFEEAICRHSSQPNIALLTTSSFGPGWAQTCYLNMEALTPSGSEKSTSPSWPKSDSLARCCGSRYAYGIAEKILRSEIKDLDHDNEQDIKRSSTWEAFLALIHDILAQEIDVREGRNSISFSSEDDLWNAEWRTRSGFPLTTYLEKWKSLSLIQPGSSTGEALSTSSVRFSDSINLSIPEAEFRLKRMAFDYLSSKPGEESAAKNHEVRYYCNALLKGANPLSKDSIEKLAGSLHYRLGKITARATEFKDRLDIPSFPFPDCRDADIDIESLTMEFETSHQAAVRLAEISSMLFDARLFDAPGEHEGMPFYKGEEYLAVVLSRSGWLLSEIQNAVNELVELKNEMSPVEGSIRILGLRERIKVKGMMEKIERELREGKYEMKFGEIGDEGYIAPLPQSNWDP